jgi:hypothetical protein
MRWIRRRKSLSLGMCTYIPRTYSRRYNHLSLGMPKSSSYSSTNMRLSRSYSILPVHMIWIVLTCIIIVFIYLGLSSLVFLGSLFGFYCFFAFSYKFKTTKIFFFCFASLLGSLFGCYFWFLLDFSLL